MKKSIYSLLFMVMAAFSFSSCEDVPAPYNTPQVITPDTPADETPAGTGTKDDPYNVAAVISYCKSLGSNVESTNDVYIKGIVTEVKEQYSANYGNVSVKIADSASGTEFYIYRAYYFNNKKWTAGDSELNVGDEVIFCGKVINYSGNTPETVQSKAWLYSLNGKTADDGSTTPDTPSTGKGSLSDPYTVAEAVAAIEAGAPTTEVYLTGIISEVSSYNATYHSITYYISDDGKSKDLQVYSGKGLNGADFSSMDDLKVGQKVLIKGIIKKYNTTNEVDKSSSIISITDGGSTTPDTPSADGNISTDGTTVTLTNSGVTEGESIKVTDISSITTDANPTTITLSDGTVLTLDINGGSTKPAYNANYNNLRIYANNKMTFTAKKQIAKIVFNCDSYSSTNYVGNETATVSFSGNTATYTNVFTGTSGGGVQLRILSFEIFYAK